MTISSETRKAGPYPGNGATTAFPFAFKVFATTDVAVVLTTVATGVQETLASGYTVALNADQNANPGGTVTYNPTAGAMTSAQTLTITSEVANTQGLHLTQGGAFLPGNIEDALDRLTVEVQQVAQDTARAIKVPVVDAGAPPDLPAAAQRAGKFSAFDASGNPTIADGTGSDSALRTDLAAADGGTLVRYTPEGTGASAALNLQSRVRKTPIYFSDYGAQGGVVDDTGHWTNFIAACIRNNRPGVIDPATFLIDAFTFDSSHSGLTLEGQVFNPQGQEVGVGHFGMPSSCIKLGQAATNYITFGGAYNLTFRNFLWDGDGLADNVHEWPGIDNNYMIRHDRCGIYGAVDATGTTIHFGGSNGGDFNVYDYCDINGKPGVSTIVPLHHIHNENTNAFMEYFKHCRFANAVWMFRYGAGSCSMEHCQMFGATTRFFGLDSVTQSFELHDIYTEQTPVPFFEQLGSIGGTVYRTITLSNITLNHASNTMLLNCQQPVRLLDVNTAGDITITPMATFGTMPVYDDGTNFLASAAFAGAGVATQLISAGGVSSAGAIRASAFAGNTNRGAATTSARSTVTGATPSVASVRELVLNNGGATNLTNFSGGADGQEIVVVCEGNTTFVHDVTKIRLAGSVNVTPTSTSVLCFRLRSNVWYETSRTIA